MGEICAVNTDGFTYNDDLHEYRLRGQLLLHTTGIIDACGLISDFCKKEEYRLRGHIVHRAMALFGMGKLDWSTVDVRIMGYILSGVRFYEEVKFKPVIIETPDYHPDFLYGFTADAVGSSNLGDLLPDFKTGVAAKLSTTLQLASYKEPMKRKYGGKFRTVAVELDSEGGAPNLKFYGNDRADFNNFISCLNVARLKEAM